MAKVLNYYSDQIPSTCAAKHYSCKQQWCGHYYAQPRVRQTALHLFKKTLTVLEVPIQIQSLCSFLF